MKYQRFPLALACALLATDALSGAPAPERVKWVQEHAAPVRSVDLDDTDYSDLAPLAKAIGNARIVQLGEATHGDGTTFLAKARLIRFLHEKMGFDVLLWESPMLGARLMDAGMRDPGKSGYEAAKDNIFGIWVESAQVQGLLDYVKQTQTTTRPIVNAGVDCRLGVPQHKEKIVPEYLIAFFDRIDPALLGAKQREEIFRICRTVEYGDYYEKPGPRNLDMSVMTNMVEYLDRHGDTAARTVATEEIEFVRQLLMSEIDYEKVCAQVGQKNVAKPVSRDMIMGRNLVWQATRQFPDRKIIVWAHNFHIMESIYLAPTAADIDRFEAQGADKGPMGHVAARTLGAQVYTVGFIGNSGGHNYANSKKVEPPTPIPPAAEGTLDWYLNQASSPHSFLDLQSLAANHWLREPLPARFYFWGENTTLWPRIYDGVFFSKEIEPSVPRAQASGAAASR